MNKTVKGLAVAAAGLAGVAVANGAVFAQAQALGNTLGGEGRFWPGPYGDLFYARQGKGYPVLLLHGIYAGASGYEWRRNFDTLSEHFEVYALDALGFGLSDKPRIRYEASQYVEQITQFIKEVIGKPCAVIGSSLSGAYAIAAAYKIPDLVNELILVCPTGMHRLSEAPGAKGEALYQALRAPLAGTTFWNLMTSAASLRYYLMNQTYFDPSYVDDAMVTHYSTASHQYGCQNAPPSFVAGLLNLDISVELPALPQNTIRIVWGREARITPLSDAEAFVAANASIELTILDKSGMLPHDEQAQGFNRIVVDLLTEHDQKTTHPKKEKKGDK